MAIVKIRVKGEVSLDRRVAKNSSGCRNVTAQIIL